MRLLPDLMSFISGEVSPAQQQEQPDSLEKFVILLRQELLVHFRRWLMRALRMETVMCFSLKLINTSPGEPLLAVFQKFTFPFRHLYIDFCLVNIS